MTDAVVKRGDLYLIEWGRWARSGAEIGRLGYPGRSAEQVAAGFVSLSSSGNESDVVCEFIDVVLQKMRDERSRQIAIMYYVLRFRLADISKKVGLSKRAVSSNLDIVRGVVFGAVELSS